MTMRHTDKLKYQLLSREPSLHLKRKKEKKKVAGIWEQTTLKNITFSIEIVGEIAIIRFQKKFRI